MNPAVFSNQSLFSEPQHVGGPIVEPETRERFHRLADEAFARNWLTNAGPFTVRLEEEVARRHGVADAVFMTNATLAQMVLMKAMGLDGGEVLVSADTFIATPHVCEWLGMRPVFVDLEPHTLNLDPVDCARRMTSATRAIVPTHVFGVLADMEALSGLARERGVQLLADAAHAFDCDRGGRRPGEFGAPEFLSFHATKFFSTLEGGAVLTNDESLAREMRELRNFGFDRPGDAGKLGTNAKASEISAAFGLASLPALEERKRRLKRVRDIYIAELSGVPGLRIHQLDAAGRNNYRYFSCFIEEGFGLCRDAVDRALQRENILTKLYFHPGCHRMTYYSSREDGEPTKLPNTDKALGSILCLPTSFVGVNPEEAAKSIAGVLVALHERAGEVAEWWAKTRPGLS